MIASISRGDRTRGVLAYVYGPGDEDEHTNQHTVAAFEDLLPDPGRDPRPDQALTHLAHALDLRVTQAGKSAPKDHVWHCSLRAAPEDPHLTDTQWEQIARRVLDASGIAPANDPDGCRWVVVRHAEDHVHIVATTVRADLTDARLHNDWFKVMAELTRIEQDYGLRQVERDSRGRNAKRTMAKRPTRAELHKAKRQGRPEPTRQTLRTAVRQSLAGATTEDEFLSRLAEHGIRVKIRRLPSGDAQGYSFNLPGERKADGEPLWFPGSELGPDLSLPKIRARLAIGADQPDPAITQANTAQPAIRQATFLTEHALASARQTRSPEEVQALAAGFGEVLDALAQTYYGPSRAALSAAAKRYGQAAYVHERAAEQEMRALRSAARALLAGGPSMAGDGYATAGLLDVLVWVAIALYRHHQAEGHRQYARATRETADQLRTAYNQTAAKPLAALTAQGRRLPPAVRDQYAQAVRSALPAEVANRVLAGTSWNALAATLAEARTHGHDPADLVHMAATTREMDSADDPAAVLLWRIRHATDLPAPLAAIRSVQKQAKATPLATPPPPTVPPVQQTPTRRR